MSTVTHLNPDALPRNPAFSHAVVVENPTRMIYVGGQNAVAPDGTIDGDDVATQTRRALANLELVLTAADATLADVVSWSIAVRDNHPIDAAFGAFQAVWNREDPPPALCVAIVAGLAHPRFLVEISAVAAGR